MSETRQPISGWFDGKRHHLPVRVYYEDTDFSGVVYHANYLKFMERARTESLRAAGQQGHGDLMQALDLVFVVRKMDIVWSRPARIDDALEVQSVFTHIRGARLQLVQRVMRGDELLVSADVELAAINSAGMPKRLPKDVAALLEPFVDANES